MLEKTVQETFAENHPNSGEHTNEQNHKARQAPERINPVIHGQADHEPVVRLARGVCKKQLGKNGASWVGRAGQVPLDFSLGAMVGRWWPCVVICAGRKELSPPNYLSMGNTFRNKNETKTVSAKEKSED